VRITEGGVALAKQLGERFGHRLRSLHASPVLRCVQTAEWLAEGAGQPQEICRDRLVGDPGVYVLDTRQASELWRVRGHEWVMDHLVSDQELLPGLAAPDEAARFLVHHMLTSAEGAPGIHVFVTHDSLVTTTAARILGTRLGQKDWPWYLEAAWFWKKDGAFHAAYRERHRVLRQDRLVDLDDRDVIEFARREIAATVGIDCPARFFLAGGAFKTLLTGRPARDLDIWAPAPEDRALLVRTLVDRGARSLEPRPYTDAYELAGRVVELPHKAEPPTLEERLARFDIALSAIGVEHRPEGTWRVSVHPLARESVRQREVLLLKPLANWRHALTTLERLRRYADELGFFVPDEEEAAVWKVFEAQPPEMQHGMLERFDRGTKVDLGVEQEALRRCR